MEERLKIGDIVYAYYEEGSIKAEVKHVLLPMATNPYLLKGIDNEFYDWCNLTDLYGYGGCSNCKHVSNKSSEEPCKDCEHIHHGRKLDMWFPEVDENTLEATETQQELIDNKPSLDNMSFFDAWEYVCEIDKGAVFTCIEGSYKPVEYGEHFCITDGILKARFAIVKPEYKKYLLSTAVAFNKPLRPVGFNSEHALIMKKELMTNKSFFKNFSCYVTYAHTYLLSESIHNHAKGEWEIEELVD